MDNEEIIEMEDELEEEQSMTAIVRKVLVTPIVEYEPDDLIAGSDANLVTYEVALRTQGSYKRGELLMLSENQYVKATSEGIASASSLVILADAVDVDEEEYAEVVVYTSGRFNADKVILPYETENDSHEELIEAVKPYLLRMQIYLKQ